MAVSKDPAAVTEELVEADEVLAEVIEDLVEEPVAVVQAVPGGWHLVSFGCWSVSISDDGQIRLPQSVSPQSVGDLCGALSAAAEVGLKVQADNQAREALRSVSSRVGLASAGGVVVSEGGVPFGAMRMPVASRSPGRGAG